MKLIFILVVMLTTKIAPLRVKKPTRDHTYRSQCTHYDLLFAVALLSGDPYFFEKENVSTITVSEDTYRTMIIDFDVNYV